MFVEQPLASNRSANNKYLKQVMGWSIQTKSKCCGGEIMDIKYKNKKKFTQFPVSPFLCSKKLFLGMFSTSNISLIRNDFLKLKKPSTAFVY